MTTTNRNGTTLSLGAMVEKFFDQAEAAAGDAATAAELAARRLERVLTRGGNTRLALALSELAVELAPGRAGRPAQAAHELAHSARAA